MKLSKRQKKNLCRILVSAAALLLLGLLSWLSVLPKAWFIRLPIFMIPYLIVGWDVLKKSVENVAHGQLLDENFLMSIATVGALVLGEYAEAVFVMLFYQVGELFQSIAVGKSRASIAALMDIRPDMARVLRDGEAHEVDPFEVSVGDLLEIRPGEKIPLDGVIEQGASELNTQSLTGESLPREVTVGDEVLSGCVNLGGLLHVRVKKPYEQSTVSKILELVEHSTLVKSKAENAVTKFAHWYTPLVVGCAVLLALIPSLVWGDWQRWLETALIFLVVSCPCALVISVPLSYFGGLGAASRHGVLIKGGNYLETLAKIDTVVFDKTGTLTEGRFYVTDILPEQGVSEKDLLSLAYLAERNSNHPIAQSIVDACLDAGIDTSVAESVHEEAGLGIRAKSHGREVLVGNAALLRSASVDFCESKHDGTVIYVAAAGQYMGCLVIADRVKVCASSAVMNLKKVGVKQTVMLTGDRAAIADRVARDVGIDCVYSQLLPADKVTKMEALMANHQGTVAFVGDGVNDAPVLARADVGIAMGALGSDAAIEAADVILTDDDPEKIVTALRVATRTRRIVLQNIVFSLTVKIGFLVLSVFGLTNMWAATFADVGVAVIAILNAMRTLRFRAD